MSRFPFCDWREAGRGSLPQALCRVRLPTTVFRLSPDAHYAFAAPRVVGGSFPALRAWATQFDAVKAGSIGDVDLDDHVSDILAEHIRNHPPIVVELPDITAGTPDPGKPVRRRPVALLFTDDQGRPIHDQRWSDMWQNWRTAAGWPEEGTFHSLRHYFATSLITAGADPTDVQRALRHSSLRITLETYVHWWPKKQRRRNVVSTALRAARTHHGHLSRLQDQS